MSNPVPLQSFLGGLSIPVPVHALMLLNGNVFGISGFVHRAARGNIEAIAGAAGLVLGGVAISLLNSGGGPVLLSNSLPHVLLSGLLVGLGTRLSNGCTSGHMVCGLSRLSLRSLVATASFFTTGVITAQLAHRDLPAIGALDWSLGADGVRYLVLQVLPFAASLLLYVLAPSNAQADSTQDFVKSADGPAEDTSLLSSSASSPIFLPKATKNTNPLQPLFRILAYLTTSVQFALALQLSGLTNPLRVVSFLLLPFHRAFDPSLAFLAAGALPLGAALYRYGRGNESARLGGSWGIPKGGEVDLKLVGGAALFGIGWGLAGICPGPGLVNLGRAIAGGSSNVLPLAGWLAAMVVGGLLV